MHRSKFRARQLRDGNGDPANGGTTGGGGTSQGTQGGQPAPAAPPFTPVPTPPAGQPATGTAPQGGQPDQQLGEGGYRALQAERELRAAEKQRADAAEQRLRELEAAGQTDQERALTTAREEGRQQAATAANAHLVRFAITAAAATAQFADPSDAVAQLQARSGEITVTGDGTVDEAAVAAMVKKLAEDKPYLLAQQQAPQFANNPGQGAGQTGGQAGAKTVAAGADLYRQRNSKN